MTVSQLSYDLSSKVDHSKPYVSDLFLGRTLSVKYSHVNVNCREPHCLTIGSYGTFV